MLLAASIVVNQSAICTAISTFIYIPLHSAFFITYHNIKNITFSHNYIKKTQTEFHSGIDNII